MQEPVCWASLWLVSGAMKDRSAGRPESSPRYSPLRLFLLRSPAGRAAGVAPQASDAFGPLKQSTWHVATPAPSLIRMSGVSTRSNEYCARAAHRSPIVSGAKPALLVVESLPAAD
jgi:hypothetical protein